jgi:AcrR family transcriptional regulator
MSISVRERPARPPLSREAVLEAGLHVLRAKGIEGVTMRAVAAELDTGPASLYVYVANRKDLLDQMFDRVAGGVDPGPPADPRRWQEQLEALLKRILAAMEAHPGIARVPLANVPTGPGATRIADHVLALLQAGGVDDRSAAWFIDVVFLYVNAIAYEASIYAQAGDSEEHVDEQIRDAFAQLSPEQYPHIFRLMGPLTSGSGEERFAFGLRLLITGLVHTEPPPV